MGDWLAVRLVADGEVRLSSSRIGAWMNLSGARLYNPGGDRHGRLVG
jgi:hypothetical protein